jgi:lipopolysaccharide/colanic/teichoic acid biosynthesis glycosyltransferase
MHTKSVKTVRESRRDERVIKGLDLVLSALALLVLSPVIVVVAAAVWLGDRGPVLFRQARVGKGGRHFTILKFRSMYIADSKSMSSQGAVVGGDAAAARSAFRTTARDDPRITPVGRFLRASHLDELPQLLNVLAGDMSLVGVRPDTPSQQADYDPGYWIERHSLRPGITGPAQIAGSDSGIAGRTAREQEWLRAPTIGLYFAILFATAGKVFRRTSF